MIKYYYNEKWINFELGFASKFNYAISNYGRLVSYLNEIKHGRLLNGSWQQGYKIMRYKIITDKKIINRHLFFHKLVAEHFLTDKTEDQTYVIHLDFDKENNKAENLKWVTKEELFAHQQKSPAVKEAIAKMHDQNRRSNGKKLTCTNVMRIKQILHNPERKTRMKIIAKQFGISEMQLYRIKTGENWGHIQTPYVSPTRGKKE